MGGNKRTEQRGGRGHGRPLAARPFGTRTLAWTAGLLLAVGLTAAAAASPPVGKEVPSDWAGWDKQHLRIHVWHGKDDGDIYRRGESLRIRFQTNHDAYAVVYRIDADGEVTILWPRSRFDDGFVFGGHEYAVPAAGTGGPLRAGAEEGVEYVEAVASLYPFDLRDLEVDFHHEPGKKPFRFAVAGDPFLAMNEVNFTITGLEDPSDYVVTDYASWYVHRRVDHPRYLCGQCHESGYRPYADRCAVDIHHDFGWANRWYVRFGYYPAYYYPAYYYVDPWSHRPWVNYWYTPWYRWPTVVVYDWPYVYYPWWDSPFYRGDAWVVYSAGNRRAAPLSKLYATRERDSVLRRRNSMVAERATDDVREAMRRRAPLSEARGQVPSDRVRPSTDGRTKDVTPLRAGGGYTNVAPAPRDRAALRAQGEGNRRPGLRLDGDRTRLGSPARGRPEAESGGGSGPAVRPRAGEDGGRVLTRPEGRGESGGSSGEPQRTIRSVQPRKPGSRIWSGGRTSTPVERRARPGQVDQPEERPRQDDQRQRPEASPQRPEASPQRPASRPEADRPARSEQKETQERSRGVERPAPQRNEGASRPSSPPPSQQSQPPTRGGSDNRTRSGGRG